jgi:hypothetical protein
MATSSGLSFIGITDHSYDLCCKMDNYLEADPGLERWKLQKQSLAGGGSFASVMLHGEEISCFNTEGATVHLGALGLTDYIPGSRDGARKYRFSAKQLTIKQAIEEIHKQGAFAFAAHPRSTSGLLQRLFLSRGAWSASDAREGIDALQAFNNGLTVSWEKAKRLWLCMLQDGFRVPIIAGNDAHGDFNRYRAVKQPFLSISEDFQRFMGYGKTGIYGQCTTQDQVLAALHDGKCYITTGPYLSINYSSDPTSHAISVHPRRPDHTLFLHCVSTAEFGRIKKLSLFAGGLHHGTSESIIFSTVPVATIYEMNIPVELPATVPVPGYIRAEVETVPSDGITCSAVTNCCFFE